MINIRTIFFIGMLLFESCEMANKKLLLINNSRDTVYYSVSLASDSIKTLPIIYNENGIDFIYSSVLFPNEKYYVPVMGSWENFINESSPDSTVKVFFFTQQMINTINSDSILKYQLMSKREKLTISVLDKMAWQLSYP